jgi:imidazolonepropionase-like amidohydrolase
MKTNRRIIDTFYSVLAIIACLSCYSETAAASPTCRLLTAARVFDGINFPMDNMSVLVVGNKIKQIGSYAQLKSQCSNRVNMGDATILPGFIESHAHISFQNVRKDVVLANGITTVQDTGGPLKAPEGGQGAVRLLSVGPILQAEGGYPLNIFSHPSPGDAFQQIGYPISASTDIESVVTALVNGGATAIKIALEPGGEAGAPWMLPHGADPVPTPPWAMLSTEQVQRIVNQAHALGKRVIAHVGEAEGLQRAIDGGVDELAHMPCATIPENLLQQAVDSGMTFVTTLDTLGSCAGIHMNAIKLAEMIENTPETEARFIYGSEIGHDNVPWGNNGEEMHWMLHLTHGAGPIDFNDVVNIFRSATSEAGKNLGLAPLGTLTPNAPADIIAVKGNPFERFKLMENPDFVMSGGRIVVNKF